MLKITTPKDSAGEVVADEVISGTISGTALSSATRGVEGSVVAHLAGATIELYQVAGIPLTQLPTTHTGLTAVSSTHLRAPETDSYLVCRLLLEKKKER